MIDAAESFLADPDAREALGRRALDLYEPNFAIARTVEQLQLEEACEASYLERF